MKQIDFDVRLCGSLFFVSSLSMATSLRLVQKECFSVYFLHPVSEC